MTTQTKDLLAGIKTKIGSVAHIQEAIRPMLIDEIMSDIEAIRASATSAQDQPDPAAWLISYESTTGPREVVHGHNAIADYRQIDPKATVTLLCRLTDQSAGAGKVMQPLKAERVKELYPEARRKWNEISDHWNSWGQLPDDEKAELICRETELAHGIQPEQPQLAGDK